MSLFAVRILFHSIIKRPCAHFRSFTSSSSLFNKSTRYHRQLTKRETNLYKQFTERHMATPINDEEIEKLLEPFRSAVKIQVSSKEPINEPTGRVDRIFVVIFRAT